jgi:Tetratricopeptide repeat
MNTKASRIAVRLLIAAAVCAAALQPVSFAQSTTPSTPAGRPSRSERLRDWLAAVERHQPGIVDDAIAVFDSWRPDDFQYLAIDLNTVLALMRDPDLRTFFYSPDRRSGRQQVYSGSDLRTLVTVALAARNRTGEDTGMPVEKRLEKNRNHVLKRAAIFHTDVALDTLLGGRSNVRAPLGLQSFTMRLPDGRSQGVIVDVGHWELARSMLDKVVPTPAGDEFVRGWYTATAAYLGGLGQLTPGHFDRGLRWFPDDAELLFLDGCLHESLAEARIQEAMQSASLPSDVNFGVSSRRSELRTAENRFRKAVKAQPAHVEARIRLARVLGQRGEHAEAEELLRAVVKDGVNTAKEPLLAYFAYLFLAVETEVHDSRSARELYTQASALYPEAQSPRLALSALAAFERKPADAVGAMRDVLALPGDTRNDPWWHYHQSQGRDAPARLGVVYKQFLEDDRR